MAYAIPEPPDLDDPDDGPVTVDDSVAIVQLAEVHGCTAADMVRWLADTGGPEGAELPPPEGTNRWLVTDDASAEWALGKMAEAGAALEAIVGRHEEWRRPLDLKARKVDEWASHARRGPAATMAHMQALLERYALARREATGKASVRLPSGKLGTVKGRTSVKVWDQARAIAVLAALGSEAVRVREPDLLVSKVQWMPGWAWAVVLGDGSTVRGLTVDGEGAPRVGETLAGTEAPARVAEVVSVVEVPCMVDSDGQLVQLDGLEIHRAAVVAHVEVAG